MIFLHVIAVLFAISVLGRHGPAALRAVRPTPSGERRPPGAVMAILNVGFALAVLAAAMKGLFAGLISR